MKSRSNIAELEQAKEMIEVRARQQAAVSELGQRALAVTDLSTLMNEAVVLLAETLEVEYCKVLELLPDGTALLLRAGVGWKAGSVGHATVSVGADSQAGYTLLSRGPVIVEDLRTETRFSGPPLLHDHSVISGMSVVIHGRESSFGVLGAHTTRRRTFTQDDIHFLQAVGNVLAAAITRTRAEEVLRASEARYQSLFNGIPVGLYRTTPGGQFLDANQALVELLGYPDREALLAINAVAVYVITEDRKRWQALMEREGVVRGFEVQFRRYDGTIVWVENNTRVVRDADGRVLSYEGSSQDITERKRAEEVRREMHVALANAMPGISRLDPEGRYVTVNDMYARMTGYEPGEMIGTDWARTVHPEDRGIALAAYQRMVSEGKAECEARAVRKDGSVFHKHVLMVKRVNQEGNFIGHHCFMRDITEHERAKETLRGLYQASLEIQEPLSLQERLDRLLQTAQTLLELDRVNILLADPERRWLQAVASLGVEEPLEAIRVPVGPEGGGIAHAYLTQQMIVWDGLAPVPEPLRLKPPYDRIAAFRSQVFANVPLVVQGRAIGVLGADRKQSRKPLDAPTLELLQLFAAQAALAIEHGRLYEAQRMAAIQLEATVEARTRELQASNAQLLKTTHKAEEASRHKSAFLANMSHELRTPLNAILGFSELLQQQAYGPLTPKQANHLDHIHASGKHLLALINDILDLSKVEAGKLKVRPQSFEVREVLEAALHTIRPQAGAKRQHLSLQVPGDLPTLVADPVRINQVLLNLLSNAVKFTSEGGSITVTARQVHSSAVAVEQRKRADREASTVDRERPGEFVEISVADTGIGINAENLQRLFQPFTQLEPVLTKRYEGSGLGLALTKKLVELHGGTIWAESVGEGKGSTFSFRLLLAGLRATPRLLVVDDDETLLGTIRDALKAAGYHVETAEDGAAALAQVEAARPDLVILDLSLPQVNGWEVLRSLRADAGTRALPVLVITGVEVGRGDEILTAGADEFLAKPFSVPVLVSTVQRLLEQSPLADRVLGWQTLARTL